MQVPLIRSVSLQNFRSFRNVTEVPLRKLTFLVGPNSAGKTSLVHGVFLLAQSGLLSLEHLGIAWSGSLAELGSFDDAVFGHDRNARIFISLALTEVPREPPWRPKVRTLDSDFYLSYELRAKEDPGGYTSEVVVTDAISSAVLTIKRRRGRYASFELALADEKVVWKPPSGDEWRFPDLRMTLRRMLGKVYRRKARPSVNKAAVKRLSQFLDSLWFAPLDRGMQRVSSARFGPRRLYERQTLLNPQVEPGVDPSIIASITPEMLSDPGRIGRTRRGRRSRPDLKHLKRQLKELGIADNLAVREISAYHRALYLRDSATGIDANLIDFGYGTSQVLPVLWGLASNNSGMLVLEQPEVHLHPRAQGIVGRYIVDAAGSRQIVVETHSEHLINQARISVAEGQLDPEDVLVLYVDRTPCGSEITPIELDSNGDFVRDWPHGFFNERFEDTIKLSRLRE